MKQDNQLSLNEFIEEAVTQVQKVFAPNDEQIDTFRTSFSQIVVDDILSEKYNAACGDLVAYGFTSASDVVTNNIARALSSAELPTTLPERKCLLGTIVIIDSDIKDQAMQLKAQLDAEQKTYRI